MGSCAVVFFVALFFTTSPAWADSNAPPLKNDSAVSCSATVDDELRQARGLIADEDAGSERAALQCLIEATAALNAHVHTLDQGRSPSGMLHVIDAGHPPAATRQ